MASSLTRHLKQSPFDRHSKKDKPLSRALVGALWGLDPATRLEHSKKYLKYYHARCKLIDPQDLEIKTHEDIVDIVRLVRESKAKSLSSLKSDIERLQPRWLVANGTSAKRAIELGVDLWLMVEVNSWEENSVIQELIQQSLPPKVSPSPASLPETFNARELDLVGGFDIIWTSRLSDHLQLDRRSKQVLIFQHASLISTIKRSRARDIYPEGILEETARTIALLFPQDLSHKRWLRRAEKKADLDLEAATYISVPRQIEEYHFWGERLRLLKEALDAAKPNHVKQWFYDRRDMSSRSAYWFAVVGILLVIMFGFIQSITGIMQVVASFKGS